VLQYCVFCCCCCCLISFLSNNCVSYQCVLAFFWLLEVYLSFDDTYCSLKKRQEIWRKILDTVWEINEWQYVFKKITDNLQLGWQMASTSRETAWSFLLLGILSFFIRSFIIPIMHFLTDLCHFIKHLLLLVPSRDVRTLWFYSMRNRSTQHCRI